MTVKEHLSKRPSVELKPVTHDQETLRHWTSWITDPDISQWMAGHIPKTPTEVNEWLYNATHDPRRHYFSIESDGKAVGMVNLRTDYVPAESGEIGIIIGDVKDRSRGIGKEAVIRVLAYAKDSLRLTSVRAHIKPANEKSIKLFVGQGFTKTGSVSIDGTVFDRYEKNLQRDTRDIIPTMQIEQHGKLYTYFHPVSSRMEKELAMIHEEISPEQKPSIEQLLPKLKVIFHRQDTKAAWGQIPVDAGKLTAGVYMFLTTLRDGAEIVRPSLGNGKTPTGRVVQFLWDIALTDLIAFVPGPQKFVKYDIAAARPELRSMAASGMLNERSVKKLIAPGRN